MPVLEWLVDPPILKGLRAPGQSQSDKDTFGLWHTSVKRPSTDRNFNPKEKSNRFGFEEARGRPKLTCPPSVCSSSKYRDFLESEPLVKSDAGKKQVLELPTPFFQDSHIPFKEIPLFAVTENHAKLCLGNLVALSQMCTGIFDYLSWLIDSLDLNFDVSSYGGSKSPGDRNLPDPIPSELH